MSTVTQVPLLADPILPQRDFLLDGDEVAQRLSAGLGADGPLTIGSCERLRVKYRIGNSLRVLYRMQVDDGSYLVACRVFPPGGSKRAYEQETLPRVGCGPLRPMFRDAQLDTIFWAFPNDRKIRTLSALVDVPGTLSGLLDSAWTHSRTVAYAPEKCATAQCLNDRMEVLAYAKVYAGEDGRHCARIYRMLWESLVNKSMLRIPRVIAYSDDHRTMLLEAIAGQRLADLNAAELQNGLCFLGAALASLHALPLPVCVSRFKRLDIDRLQHAAHIIGLARPDVARLARELSHQLGAQRKASSDIACLHGDVHPKNGILTDNGLALVDLDQVAAGPAAADLGSMLGGLRYQRCIGAISAATETELAGAFLSGYERVHALPNGDCLRWHSAAALLAERALRAVNRIRPDGLQHLGELLAEAQALLTEKYYD
jgi:aminoglycoside phosphotransferase